MPLGLLQQSLGSAARRGRHRGDGRPEKQCRDGRCRQQARRERVPRGSFSRNQRLDGGSPPLGVPTRLLPPRSWPGKAPVGLHRKPSVACPRATRTSGIAPALKRRKKARQRSVTRYRRQRSSTGTARLPQLIPISPNPSWSPDLQLSGDSRLSRVKPRKNDRLGSRRFASPLVSDRPTSLPLPSALNEGARPNHHANLPPKTKKPTAVRWPCRYRYVHHC